MKAWQYDSIELTSAVSSDFTDEVFPSGTQGTVVECYSEPEEGYDVDVAVPDTSQVTGFRYDHVTCSPDQFRVLHEFDG